MSVLWNPTAWKRRVFLEMQWEINVLAHAIVKIVQYKQCLWNSPGTQLHVACESHQTDHLWEPTWAGCRNNYKTTDETQRVNLIMTSGEPGDL